jgi:hypothetical protein
MTRERPETKISPVVESALCMAFRGTLSRRQQDTLDRFKATSPQFAAMRKLAMNFRAILFGADPAEHDILRAQLIPIEGLSVQIPARERHSDSGLGWTTVRGRPQSGIRKSCLTLKRRPFLLLDLVIKGLSLHPARRHKGPREQS